MQFLKPGVYWSTLYSWNSQYILQRKNSILFVLKNWKKCFLGVLIRDLSYLLFYKWIDIFITMLCIFLGDDWVLHICQKYTEANKGNLINIIFCTMFFLNYNIQLYIKWFLKWNFICVCLNNKTGDKWISPPSNFSIPKWALTQFLCECK